MIDLMVGVATVAFIATGTVVGLRFLALAHRTRQLSDFLIGFALFDICAIGYPLALISVSSDLPLASARAMTIAYTLALALAWVGMYAFTLRVFRPGAGWAWALCAGGLALTAVGVVITTRQALAAPDSAALRLAGESFHWVQVAALICYAWTGCEGFRCWQAARRRLALGLSDPLVVDRFLLWAAFGLFAFISVAPSAVLSFAGMRSEVHVAIERLGVGIGGGAAAIAMQLAFLPPPFYKRWVIARSQLAH